MNIDDIKREILSKLNLQTEFEFFGIKLIGKPSSKGWIKCPSPFNPDKFPSCGVCVDNSSSYSGFLRIFNNSGPRQAIGFFDLARELNPNCMGKEFIEVLKFYADKTSVEFNIKNNKKTIKPKGKIVATYDYVNLSDELMYQVCRLKPKSFRQRRPDPQSSGAWLWNMEDVSALPYYIRNVTDSQTVYIVEGEKCADDLIEKFLLPATTFHGGAGKWYPEVLQYFQGKNLILLPDNDTPGKEHMQRLAHAFKATAKSVKIIELPGLQPKGDISDWIIAGNTKDQLLDLCKKTFEVEEIEDPIDELNRTHAIVIVGSKVKILYETIDIDEKPDIQFLSDYDFRILYANRKVPNPLAGQKGQAKHIPLPNAWLNSPKRREYKGIVFEPKETKETNFYNLYRGFAYQPIKNDWSLFKNHIYENICNNNVFYYDWLMVWLARIVQDPGGKKPGTCVVLRGERGTGKGVFVEIFGKIFGHHFLQVTNSGQITGRFNSHLKDCILLFIDEAWFAGNKSTEGVFKGLITSDRHMVELKGKDAFMVSNHVNCIVASNNDWVVPVGNKERRFFVLDVSNRRIQNHEYFAAIHDQMFNQGGIEAMLYELLNIDILQHNLREAPKTKALADQRAYTKSSFESFFEDDILNSNFELCGKNGVMKSKFYNLYTDFCKKINTKYIMTPAIFGKNLLKYCPEVEIIQKRDVDKMIRFYVFPEKNRCRELFNKILGPENSYEINKKSTIQIEIDGI